MKNLLTVINSNPSMAAKAYAELYHGKTFAIGRSNGHIDTFKKTLRGAEGYIKREQSGSYYDEYSNEMVSYGSGMFIQEIKESDILNPADSLVLWFNYLRDIQGQDYLYTQALRTAEYLSVSEEIMNYVVSSIDDMKNNRGLTIIEEVSAQVEEVIEVNEVVENEVIETIEKIEATYKLNEEKQGIEIYFSSIPSEEVRNVLKVNGFRWSKYNKCWYAKQSDKTIQLVKGLCNHSDNEINEEVNTTIETAPTFEYPEINIDDNETYTIDQTIQDRENDNSLFRNSKRDHNKEMQSLFSYFTDIVKDVLTITDNLYYEYKLKQSLQRFKKAYHTAYIKYLSHKGNNPSWVVTGRGNLNVNRYNKAMDKQDKLMLELADLPKQLENEISKYKSKIRKDQQTALRQQTENTQVTIDFKIETKEFTFMNITEKKRVHSFGEYFIVKTWGCFRLFYKGNEINSNLKTTDNLETAKKALTLYIQQKEQRAS